MDDALVGRDPELALLRDFLARSAVDGGALLLTGDPGVGKTALLEAAAARGRHGGSKVPATYGFAVRNGRPLADNAPEVMLSLVTGTAIPSGLKPAVTGHLRTGDFPYVVPGHSTK